jgi:phosphoglycerate dehydrogenase-like enzyme
VDDVAGQVVRVLVGSRFSPQHLDRIRGVSPRIDLSYEPHSPYQRPEEPPAGLAEVEVLVSHHARFAISAAPRLRWLQLPGDGADHLRGAPIMNSDVVITNARVFGVPIAEYVIGSVIAYYRRFPQMMERFQKGRAWPRNQWDEYAGEDLAGKTMAVIGHGAIGRRLARVAQAMDVGVIGTRRTATAVVDEDGVEVHPAAHLHAVLSRADVVVVCLPLTAETEGVIDEAALRSMKPTAYLVSVGRGKVIEPAALLRALREGWIGGAGLDVYAETPLPPNNPLFDLPNVILTPHMSGVSQGYYERVMDLFCGNLRRYLAGEPLVNVVNKQSGY